MSNGTTGGAQSSNSSGKPGRGWGRRLLIGTGVLIVLVLVLVALAPTIAGWAAPGYIESAAKGSIKGSVKVGRLGLGWFSPTTIGPVEVRDEKGRLTARLDISTPATTWSLVSTGLGGAKNIDLGTVTLAGMIDAERDTTGKSNLQRAVEPKAPAPTPAPATAKPASGSGIQSLRAALKITNLDISVHDLKPDGTTSDPIGVKALHGDASVDYAPGRIVASADMNATPVGGGPGAGVPLSIKVNADIKPTTNGGTGLDKADVKAELAGAPIALIDALANLGGALTSAVGPTAKATIEASGNAQAATAHLALESDGVKGNLTLALKDGILSAEPADGKPNGFSIRSTEFAASLPAFRDNIARAKQAVRLTGPAPALDLTIDKLRIPLPSAFVSALAGNKPAPIDPAALDLRAASLVARLTVGPMDGQVALDQGGASAGARAQPDAKATPAADWQVFHVEQGVYSIDAPDLSQPVSLKGGTKATLAGQSAGELAVSARASGLLDKAGHLKALGREGLADSIDGELRIAGVSTALAQPLITSLGLPVDLRQDVGPALDLTVNARADTSGAQSPADIPSTAITVSLKGSNVQLQGAARMDKGVLSTEGDGFSLNVVSASGLAGRFANPAGQPPTAQFSGTGRLTGTVRGLRADLAKLKGDAPLSGVAADISASLNDLTVKPAAFDPKAAPVEARSIALGLHLAPGAAPTLDVKSDLVHQNQPFAAAANLALNGLKDGRPPAGGGLDAAFKLGVNGSASVTSLPHSLLAAVPALKTYLADPGSASDMNAQIARAVQATIGKNSTLKLDFSPLAGKEPGTQARLTFETDGKAITAGLDTSVTASTFSVTRLVAVADVAPAKVNPVLAAAAQQSGATPGAQPMRIAEPFTLQLSADPITLPLANKNGVLQPDFAKASAAAITVSTNGDLAVDNVVIGADDKGAPRLTQVRLHGLNAQLNAPLAGLAAGAAPNTRALVKAGASLLTGGSDKGSPLAEFSLDAGAAMDGSKPQGTVKLSNIDTRGLDALLAQGGLLAGALGDKADISAKAEPKGKTTLITADINAPRFQGASIAMVQDETQTALTQPATITWTPDAAFLTRLVNGPPTAAADKSGASPPLQVSQAAPITIQLTKLAIAPSKTESGAAVSGPLKPGVFALDAVVSTPSVGLSIAGGQVGAQGKQASVAPVPAELQGIRIAAHSTSGQAPGLDAELSIDKITGGGSAGQKKSTAKLSLANLADERGVLHTDQAVLNLDADFQTFPTPIADALGRQGGLLTEALGPTVNLTATAKNITKGAKAADGNQPAGPVRGMLDVKADSARASAAIKGRVRNGAFHQDGAVSVKIVEIRPELVRALAGSVPVVDTVEKTTKDAPATFDGEGLQVPIDGDLRKLNGVAKIDPGILRFTTKPIFGDLVGALGGKSNGVVGQKIEPFVVRFDKGVATYDRFTLPVGTFNLETKGTVDLVQRQIDVITYVPLFALTDKAAGVLNQGIAGKLGVVDKSTLVPIRTRGSLDNPKTEVDPGLFLKETGDKILKDPGKTIEKGLDDALKNILKPKKK